MGFATFYIPMWPSRERHGAVRAKAFDEAKPCLRLVGRDAASTGDDAPWSVRRAVDQLLEAARRRGRVLAERAGLRPSAPPATPARVAERPRLVLVRGDR